MPFQTENGSPEGFSSSVSCLLGDSAKLLWVYTYTSGRK